MVEDLNVRYLTDDLGNKTDVQISYQAWMEIEKKLTEYAAYQVLRGGLVEAFKEVKDLKQNKKSRVSLKEFLNEY